MRRRAAELPEEHARGAAEVLSTLETAPRRRARAAPDGSAGASLPRSPRPARRRGERSLALAGGEQARPGRRSGLVRTAVASPSSGPRGDSRKKPSDAELHDLRIRTKRVRYAAEAAAPLFGRRGDRVREGRSRSPDGPRRPERRGRRAGVASRLGEGRSHARRASPLPRSWLASSATPHARTVPAGGRSGSASRRRSCGRGCDGRRPCGRRSRDTAIHCAEASMSSSSIGSRTATGPFRRGSCTRARRRRRRRCGRSRRRRACAAASSESWARRDTTTLADGPRPSGTGR